jgi:hypothetical protein
MRASFKRMDWQRLVLDAGTDIILFKSHELMELSFSFNVCTDCCEI